MTKEELNRWHELITIREMGTELDSEEYRELIRLNHSVMTLSHDVHNNDMLKDRQ